MSWLLLVLLLRACVSADGVCVRGLHGAVGRSPSEPSCSACSVQRHELRHQEHICPPDLSGQRSGRERHLVTDRFMTWGILTECLCSWPYKNCPKEIISLHVYSCTLCFETWNIWILSKKFLEERNESIVDFFQTLDKEGTMKVSTSAFRKAVKVRLTLKTSYIHTRHYKNRKLPDWAEVFRYSLLYG